MRLEIHEGTDIKSMISSEGEIVSLQKPPKVRNNVETWLLQVQCSMVETL